MKSIKDLIDAQSIIRDIQKYGKNVLLYGLDAFTKGALFRLIEQGIGVSGFVVRGEEKDLTDIRYLNQPVLFQSTLMDINETCLVVDIFGQCPEDSPLRTRHLVRSYLPGQVIVYGAGYQGRRAQEYLRTMGVNVIKFCDRDANKRNAQYFGIDVISLEDLQAHYFGIPVVVALDSSVAGQVMQALVDAHRISDGYLYTELDDQQADFFTSRLLLQGKDETKTTGSQSYTYPYVLHQMIAQEKQNKRLLLYGYRHRVSMIYERLQLLGIHIHYGIDVEGFAGQSRDGNLLYRGIFDLLYEHSEDIAVWVLPEAVKPAQQFVRESGIDARIFYQIENAVGIRFRYLLDPNLGYNIRSYDHESFVVLRNDEGNTAKAKRIGIVGGSTSDVTLFNERSWPEQLLDIARSHGIELVIYGGGTGGYVVAQEMIKFVRDMSHCPLDILISYSRINEAGASKRNYFFHTQQISIIHVLEKLEQQKDEASNFLERDGWLSTERKAQASEDSGICFGKSIHDYAEHWLHQERVMHGVCQEFGIKFYALMQPYLFDQCPMTRDERELKEHVNVLHMPSERLGERESILQDIAQKIRKINDQYPWLVDLTNLFQGHNGRIYRDAGHLTSDGNRILAQHIFSLLENDLRRGVHG